MSDHQPPRFPQPGQPFPNQPFPNQQYPNQPYPNQPYPNQPYPNQTWPQQAWGPPPPPPAESQVQAPAICLLVLAILGALHAVYGLAHSVVFKDTVPKMMQQATTLQEQMNAQMERERRKRAEEMGIEFTPQVAPPTREVNAMLGEMIDFTGRFGIVMSAIGILFCGVSIAGSVSMLRLRYYPLAFAAAILAMIPGTSPCCVFGLPLGIWGVVVLLRPEVKKGFQ